MRGETGPAYLPAFRGYRFHHPAGQRAASEWGDLQSMGDAGWQSTGGQVNRQEPDLQAAA